MKAEGENGRNRRKAVVCVYISRANAVCAAMLLLAAVLANSAFAQQRGNGRERGGSGRGPVYQRHAHSGSHGERGPGRGNFRPNYPVYFPTSQTTAGWFQRPYPYHLDYYRMRYGGSYAPYFGNLYGPPQVVTAPPYYGPYYGGPVYGGYEGYGVGQPPAMMPPPTDGEAEKVAE
jgi:hypothetical protein